MGNGRRSNQQCRLVRFVLPAHHRHRGTALPRSRGGSEVGIHIIVAAGCLRSQLGMANLFAGT